MDSLAAKAPLLIKLVLPAVVILFAVAVGLPKGAGFWAAWYLLKAALSLAAFVALSALGFLVCVTARTRFEKILENNRKWEALQARSGTQHAAMESTVAALSSPPLAGLVFTGTLPNVRISPTDLLFANFGIPFEVSKELGSLVSLVMRDFVYTWYPAICSEDKCGLYIQHAMTSAIGILCTHIASVNVPVFLADDAAEAVLYHLKWYGEMVSRAHRQRPGAFKVDAGATIAQRRQSRLLQQRLVMRQYMEVKVLHPAVDPRNMLLHGMSPYEVDETVADPSVAAAVELAYIRKLSAQLVPHLLPECERASAVISLLLNELLSNILLQPTMALFEPHTINSWIPLLWEEAPAIPLSGQSVSSTDARKQTVLSAVGVVLKAVVDEEAAGDSTPAVPGMPSPSPLFASELSTAASVAANDEPETFSDDASDADNASSDGSSDERESDSGSIAELVRFDSEALSCTEPFESPAIAPTGTPDVFADVVTAIGTLNEPGPNNSTSNAVLPSPELESVAHTSPPLLPANTPSSTACIDTPTRIDALPLPSFNADEVMLTSCSTGEVLVDEVVNVSVLKSVSSAAPAQQKDVTVASLLSGVLDDFDPFEETPTRRSSDADNVVAELFLKDQQDIMRRRQGKLLGTSNRSLAPIPETTTLPTGAPPVPPPRLRAPAGLTRDASFSHPSSSASNSVGSSRSLSIRHLGTATTVMGGFAGGGHIAYIPEQEVVFSKRLSRNLWPAAQALASRLAKRPSEADVKRHLRPPQELLTATVVGFVSAADAQAEAAASSATPVQVPVGSDSSKAVLYQINVQSGGKAWKVFCRYSEFSALHDLLHAECPSFKGTMPPKRRFLAEDLKFLEARRVALARWMDDVMQNPFTRCCYEVTTFLTRRSKASNATSALSQMLRAPIGFVMTPSRKIINMLGMSGKSETADASSSSSSIAAAGGGGADKPSQTKRRKRQNNAVRASPKIDTLAAETAGQSSTSENPFTGVNAEAGCVPEASKIAAFAGASARAGGAKAPQLRSASLLSKDEQERAEARISSLVHEVFGVRSKAWWHRHMLSMMENVAKVLFQGVASRTLREKYEEITSPVYIGECIHMIVDVLWPGGKFMETATPPSMDEQLKIQENALRIIRSMFSALDTVVDSEVGCEKVHGFLQYPALVKSLAYTLVDMLLMRAFQGFQAHGLPHASI